MFCALIFSVFGGVGDVTLLYSKHSPLNFSPSLIGYFFAEFLFLKGVGVVLGIPLLTKVLKWSDFSIAIIGAFIATGFYLFIGFSSDRWMMFVGKYLWPERDLFVLCIKSSMQLPALFFSLGQSKHLRSCFHVFHFNLVLTKKVWI